MDSKLKWKNVECGREFDSTYRTIKYSIHSGCRQCNNNKMRKGLDYCIKFVKDIKIKCLSKEYKNALTSMQWQCEVCDH